MQTIIILLHLHIVATVSFQIVQKLPKHPNNVVLSTTTTTTTTSRVVVCFQSRRNNKNNKRNDDDDYKIPSKEDIDNLSDDELNQAINSFLSIPSYGMDDDHDAAADDDDDDDDCHSSSSFATTNPKPQPGMTPGETVDVALRSLRYCDGDERKGSEVLMTFCAPLKRRERWGGGVVKDAWKEMLRGAITPIMLSRRIRASPFSGLLDWTNLSVTSGSTTTTTTTTDDDGSPFESSSHQQQQLQQQQPVFSGTTAAYVNAAMFFEDGVEPVIITFTLKKVKGVWLIDTAVVSEREWFMERSGERDGKS